MSNTYDFIDRTLDTRTTPLAYIYGVKSVIMGISYGFLAGVSGGVQNTILYKEGALVGHNLWGILGLVGGLLLIAGMLMRVPVMVRTSSFLLFTTWVFAAIVYGMSGFWLFLFPLALIEMLACGYLYLATGRGRLWDYTPARTSGSHQT